MARGVKSKQPTRKVGGPKPADGGPRPHKAAAVSDIAQRLRDSAAVVLTEYRGLTVRELADLRQALHTAEADYKVIKNTLARIAAKEAGLEDLIPLLEGPTAAAYAGGDPVAVAKQLSEFAKRAPALVVKGIILEGRILPAGEAKRLATLESREVMLAKTAGLFASPIQSLANLLAAGLNQMGAVLAQLRERLEKEAPAAETPAAEAPAAEAAAEEPAAESAAEETTAAAPETPGPEAPEQAQE